MNKPLIIAHRGASKAAPENTLPAFRKAMETGAGGIELDVQLTSDDKLVVIHDEAVNRTSNGTGFIKDKSFAELRELDFGGWFSKDFASEKIPTLEEVLELISGWNGLLNIEIKNGPVFYPGIEQKTINAVNKFGIKSRVIISSFNHYSLVEVKRIERQVRTGILYMAGLYNPWDYARMVGADAIHPLFYNIIPEIVSGCKKNGIILNPFTVDEPKYIKMMANAGVNGIITNVPDIALKIINENGG